MGNDVVVVAGAGGFIGGNLVRALLKEGQGPVRAVDIKPAEEWFQRFDQAENLELDLRLRENCELACRGARHVYNLAAEMGGMGFITYNKALCMLSVLINTHLLLASQDAGGERFFYSSSACVYSGEKQKTPDARPLKEEDAYPALSEDGYGWEKLFAERMCRHFREDFGLQTRVVRYHNTYGPYGSWNGGREKAPAAISRKVIEAKLSGNDEIEIWGDGTQARSYTYIDDCIRGTRMVMDSDILYPINVGSSELVTVDQLVDAVEEVAGVKLKRRYNLDAPRGVSGRNSDNTNIRKELGWEPSIPFRQGIEVTYAWIYDQYVSRTTPRAGARGSAGSPQNVMGQTDSRLHLDLARHEKVQRHRS